MLRGFCVVVLALSVVVQVGDPPSAHAQNVPLLDPELEQPEPTPIEEPEEPRARPGHGAPLHWDDRWGRWGVADQVMIGILLAGTVGFQIAGPRRADDPWVRTSTLDETVRDGMRFRSEAARQRIRDASDVFLSLTVAWPLLFDALASALWYHESPRVARELALLSVETQFVTATIQSFANMISSRQRPYVQDCGTEVDPNDRECKSRVRYRSFFSGHTSQAFAGAATTCMYHARLPLYGGGTREAIPCIAMMTLAAATGAFRIMGDMHWITDVLTGAVVGIAAGVAVPALRMRAQRGRLQISLVPNGLGLGVTGAY